MSGEDSNLTVRPVRDDHAALLRDATPAIDVRSPGEFARGAIPGAVNLPLLTDDERVQVGICYRIKGRGAAIALGHELISDAAKRKRVAAWRAFALARGEAVFYCARGGLRSAIAQQWLAEDGVTMPCVQGGFKALRQTCLDTLEQARHRRLLLVGGRTGTGKTRVLRQALRGIDLEGLANHRGSSFGAFPTPQPTPVAFENALAANLLGLPEDALIAVEDEGRTIGRLGVPAPLFDAMQMAPIVLLEAPDAERVDNILREYVLAADRPQEQLPAALVRIKRRLGGKRYQEIAAQMAAAFAAGPPAQHPTGHREWIRHLLAHYYDPMYDHQLAEKSERIVLRGDTETIAAYLAEAVGATGTCARASGDPAGAVIPEGPHVAPLRAPATAAAVDAATAAN